MTPTDYDHEREAFEQIRALIPDAEPYRAWSNFMFTSSGGRPYEVDALLLTPAGFLLIEVKSWVGRLALAGPDWVKTGRGGKVDKHRNVHHTTDMKAKHIKQLLEAQCRRRRIVTPRVDAAVYFSKPGLVVDLPERERRALYGLPANVGDLAAAIGRVPGNPAQVVTAEHAAELVRALERIGISESTRFFQAGDWELDRDPIATGRTWQDHLAAHRHLPAEVRRVRLYLVEREAAAEQRASIERAAKREARALRGIDHPGIVRVDNFTPHDAGAALVYRHDPRSRRLDEYLADEGADLPMLTRAGLVRQLVEALAYAHGQRLYHRSLSARTVQVVPPLPAAGGTEAGVPPRLEIIDWNVASRSELTAGDPAVEGTSHASLHVADPADLYLAPEWRQPGADPIALDVYGAGALAYALFTGKPPATDLGDLLRRLHADRGLRPSASVPGISAHAEALVHAATAPAPGDRLSTMDDLLRLLDRLDRELAAERRSAAAERATADVLEARPGDRFRDWVVEDRIGAGSTALAYLATHADGTPHVLKVARSPGHVPLLEQEASVLRRLRNDSRVIRLVRPDVVDLGGRSLLVFEYVGRDTLARRLRTGGRLTTDELESYGDQLLDVLAFLEGEAVHHRDIKPDNIVIRVRPNGTQTPVLFDFSLAGMPAEAVHAGTLGYLDPFLGTPDRPGYDVAAERYALAVTLHEMAANRLPVWGDGRTEPRFTEGPPVLAADAFAPALRDGLVEFFTRALDRDAAARFGSVKAMRVAWNDVFRTPASAPAAPVAPPAAPPAVIVPPPAVPQPPAAASPRIVQKPPTAQQPPVAKQSAVAQKSAAPPPVADVPVAGAPTGDEWLVDPADLEVARAAISTLLRERGPVPIANVGSLVKEVTPRLHADKWSGATKFTTFLSRYLPEFRQYPGPNEAGWLALPTPPPKQSPPAHAKTPAPPVKAASVKAPPVKTASAKAIGQARVVLLAALVTEGTLPLPTAAQLIRDEVPAVAADWAGTGKFTKFVVKHLADFTYRPDPDGYLAAPGKPPGPAQARQAGPATAAGAVPHDVQRARTVVLEALRAKGILPLPTAAQLIRDEVPAVAADWAGTGKFTKFVVKHLPDIGYQPDPDGYLALRKPAAVPPQREPVQPPPPARRAAVDAHHLELAHAVVLEALQEHREIPLGQAANLIRQAVPAVAADWAGTGRFTKFVTVYLTEFVYRPDPDGSLALPPGYRRRSLMGNLADWITGRR
ncbi:protein kinase domain-containing protein [Dactylosporangium matsuzakiense]|uniref:protein kinase domain-containing protein n=1 Tax=Dactylosporangium matsuzakiense TaxID=53360 RepID=UPI0021C4061B|nr:protein kinase [Dactylosporangium matsuzakiense]UWZ45911.1 protein kinase [Dactylosporangium matsuzakiense]